MVLRMQNSIFEPVQGSIDKQPVKSLINFRILPATLVYREMFAFFLIYMDDSNAFNQLREVACIGAMHRNLKQ